MSYILDTDISIYWLRDRSAKTDENLKAIDGFLRKVRVLTLNKEGADRFGRIKIDLESKR